jgi:hypothetical protein
MSRNKHSGVSRGQAKRDRQKKLDSSSSSKVMSEVGKSLSKVDGGGRFQKMKNKFSSFKDKAKDKFKNSKLNSKFQSAKGKFNNSKFGKKFSSFKDKAENKFGSAKDKFKNSAFGKKSSKVAKGIAKAAKKFRLGKVIGKVGAAGGKFLINNASDIVGAFATGFASAAGSDIYNRVFGSDGGGGGDDEGGGSGYGQGQQQALESGSDMADAAADSAIGSIGDKSPSGDLSGAIDDKKGQLSALNGELADLDKLENEGDMMSKNSKDILKSYGIGSSGLSNKPIKIKESGGKKFSDYFGPKKMEGSDVAQAYGDSQGVDPQKIDRIIQLLEGNNELVANEAKIAGMPAKLKESDIEGSMKATKASISSLRSKESYEKSANAIVESGGSKAGSDAGNSTASGGYSGGGGDSGGGGSTDSSDKDSGIGIGSALKYGALAYGVHKTGLDSYVGGKIFKAANSATATNEAKHKDDSGHYVAGGRGKLDHNAATKVDPNTVKVKDIKTKQANDQLQSGVAEAIANRDDRKWYQKAAEVGALAIPYVGPTAVAMYELNRKLKANAMLKSLKGKKFKSFRDRGDGTVEVITTKGESFTMNKDDFDKLKLKVNDTEIKSQNAIIDQKARAFDKSVHDQNYADTKKELGLSYVMKMGLQLPSYITDFWNNRNNYYDKYKRKGKKGTDAYRIYFNKAVEDKLVPEYKKFLTEITHMSSEGKLTDKTLKDTFLKHFKVYGAEAAVLNRLSSPSFKKDANEFIKGNTNPLGKTFQGVDGSIYFNSADFDRNTARIQKAQMAQLKVIQDKKWGNRDVAASSSTSYNPSDPSVGYNNPKVNNTSTYNDLRKAVTEISNNIIRKIDEEKEKK